ncbi:hypothetical protein [Butyrivibrio sp.]|uniref:hypothetical protein n=1 Tax=Butyrivibrio sp. TaxID=28121 RepID=UPI0025BB539D|nr:hypothetical protein [Butyrivibrio sp.]MBE5839286.1 hypothetical protein [Butyrivibrio sp.]
MSGKAIREYFDDYIKYYPERWRWSLKNSDEQSERYLQTRARRSAGFYGQDKDLKPDFYSIERDAAQFELRHVEWTDFFGLTWEGQKGILARAGAPNYQGNLYYYDNDESYDDENYCVSYEYDAYDDQPPANLYTKVRWDGIHHWIDTANACDIEYKYVVNNHLFKDTHIELRYEDGEELRVYEDYEPLIEGLLKQGKNDLVEKVFRSMNEHFLRLRDSSREEERAFYPGKTAEEMFLGNSNKE